MQSVALRSLGGQGCGVFYRLSSRFPYTTKIIYGIDLLTHTLSHNTNTHNLTYNYFFGTICTNNILTICSWYNRTNGTSHRRYSYRIKNHQSVWNDWIFIIPIYFFATRFSNLFSDENTNSNCFVWTPITYSHILSLLLQHTILTTQTNIYYSKQYSKKREFLFVRYHNAYFCIENNVMYWQTHKLTHPHRHTPILIILYTIFAEMKV